MTVTDPNHAETQQRCSLDPRVARNLVTTTKSIPQMQGISSRWLPKMLEWVPVSSGTYRVNRRLSYAIGDGRMTFTTVGSDVRVVPSKLCELSPLRGLDDVAALTALADRFEQREVPAGEVVAEFGHRIDEVLLIAYGKVTRTIVGPYGDASVLDVLADGDHLGVQVLADPDRLWEFTAVAATPCTVLTMPVSALQQLEEQFETLSDHLERYRNEPTPAQNKHGEAAIEIVSGHFGEPDLPDTYVDYDAAPREYRMSVTQTVLRVHSRVADLYSNPMNQVEQQLRLTVEALREREEHELVNNREFGLLHNVDRKQRLHTHGGPPTPDDLDKLLTRRRKTRLFLAHPRTIAAFGQECTRQGIYPQPVELSLHPGAPGRVQSVKPGISAKGVTVQAWRGVPILPCDKIPISKTNTTTVLAMRIGEKDEGVVGLRPATLPDEYQPGLNVRFLGIDDKAIMSYLVSVYHSVAVLVPDALGVLENVQLGR